MQAYETIVVKISADWDNCKICGIYSDQDNNILTGRDVIRPRLEKACYTLEIDSHDFKISLAIYYTYLTVVNTIMTTI